MTPLPSDSDLWEPAVPAHSEIPEHCPQPDRPCQWERERRDFNSRLTRIERMMMDIHAALAVGSERFRNSARRDEQADKLEADIASLAKTVDKLSTTVGLLRTLVFGGVGMVLVAFFGALIAMVVKS